MVKSAFAVLMVSVIASPAGDVCADLPLSEGTGSKYEELREKAKKRSTDPITGSRLYWTRGLHLEGAKKNLILKVGGKFAVNTGNIDADDELGTAFPDLEAYQTDLNHPDKRIRFSTPPESRLTDERLVDTDRFFSDGIDVINPEFALVSGPFSLQSEYFHAFVDSQKNLQFFGGYLNACYVLTGEHRRYNPLRSIFTGVRPDNDFHPPQGKWGAWEVGARFSYLDLNDGPIRGGEELNFTAGVNWCLFSNARVMFNDVRANLKDREGPPVNNGSADIFMSRFHMFF